MSLESRGVSNVDLIVSWFVAILSWVAAHIPELVSFLFITVPAGAWSWLRLIDYLRSRKKRAPTLSDG